MSKVPLTVDYNVLADSFNSVQFILDTKAWIPEPVLERQIEDAWQKQVAEAKSKGREMLNGSMVRVKGFDVGNRILQLFLQYTDFKHYMGTIDNQDSSFAANPLSIGGITVTSDNKIVLGRRPATVATGSGQFQLAPAGYVTIEDVSRSNDFSSTFTRELYEER